MTVANLNRRSFLRRTALAGGAALALEGLINSSSLGRLGGGRVTAAQGAGGYGALIPQAAANTGETLLALPEAFQYNVIGKVGSMMADGRATPGGHDGMAAFDVSGMINLVRNHELTGGTANSVAFGSNPYDNKATGGTTTLVVDPVSREVVYSFASISGTVRNCAGGPTPWGSWLTCEETTLVPAANNTLTRPHGYIFEVPAGYGEAAPVALTAMGRFSHEAVAVDPATGIVYETEDAGNTSGFYRFVPNQPGNLAAGGTFQMLGVAGQPTFSTITGLTAGQEFAAIWVPVENPDPAVITATSSVYAQGRANGGTQFSRLEGCWYDGSSSIYFVSTSGGQIGRGQVFQYTPTGNDGGVLKLVYESTDAAVLDSPDNLLVTPRGCLLLCEDGSGVDYLRGLTQQGEVFDFATRVNSESEVAGATFSGDGQTLFFNCQGTGETFAVWPKPGRSWEEGAI